MNSSHDAYIKVAAICARGEKCIFDIEKKLYDWGVEPYDVHSIVEQLVEEKFIDESRFTELYVKDKFKFNKWGKIKIRYQLRAKNISGEMVEVALDKIDAESYFQTLLHLLSQKQKNIKETDVFKFKASLIRFASSRGFEPECIYKALDELSIN